MDPRARRRVPHRYALRDPSFCLHCVPKRAGNGLYTALETGQPAERRDTASPSLPSEGHSDGPAPPLLHLPCWQVNGQIKREVSLELLLQVSVDGCWDLGEMHRKGKGKTKGLKCP